jgi:hypothetical protein
MYIPKCTVIARCVRNCNVYRTFYLFGKDAWTQFLLIEFRIFYYIFYTLLPTAYGYIVVYSEMYILPLPCTMLYILN